MTQEELEGDILFGLDGKRFLDTKNDVAFTVIGHPEGPPQVSLQFDDGRCCHPKQYDSLYSEIFPPNMGTALLRLQRANIEDDWNDDRFSYLGEGPSLYRSEELCSEEGHSWSVFPDEIWPDAEGLPHDARRLYRRLAKCEKCGLSGETLHECSDENLPWWCGFCEEVFTENKLSSLPPEYAEPYACSDCASGLN